MMYVMERLMETSLPIIIEGNFVPMGIKRVKAVTSLIVNGLQQLFIIFGNYKLQTIAFYHVYVL